MSSVSIIHSPTIEQINKGDIIVVDYGINVSPGTMKVINVGSTVVGAKENYGKKPRARIVKLDDILTVFKREYDWDE
jgi:hypothetical protein